MTKRLEAFLIRCVDVLWDTDAPFLVETLNGVRNAPEHERRELIVNALDGQRQRLLNQAVSAVNKARRAIAHIFGENGRELVDAFLHFAEADAAGRAGVTDSTVARIDMLRGVMADHLLAIVNERLVDGAGLRGLLEGDAGISVIWPCIVEDVRARYPHFVNPDLRVLRHLFLDSD